MTCSEALCYGVPPSYPVISLALNSISMPRTEEGRLLNTGTRCLSFCGDGRVIVSNEILRASACMYVLLGVTSMCEDQYEKNLKHYIH